MYNEIEKLVMQCLRGRKGSKFMEILLNPNIAYLVLMLGLVLGILAVFVPGTGLLEAMALIILVVAGWEVFNQPINILALFLLILGVFPFLLAVRKSGRTIYLVLCILALVLGSLFLFTTDRWWIPAVNPLLALVVSALSSGFLWLAARKSIEAQLVPRVHDRDNLIGSTGKTTSKIDPEGTVQISSELWTARSQQAIPAGVRVRVVARNGFILTVEKV
jgi:membrane-bound serine protease (ClpP class)